jgi:hypothetical protein
MSLTIDNIGNLSDNDIEDAFDNQFGSVVMVETSVAQSLFCTTKRKATIYITTSSIELYRFMRMIERMGSSTIVIKRAAYKITLTNLSRIEEHINL